MYAAIPPGGGWHAYGDPSSCTPYRSSPSWVWPPPSYSSWTCPNSMPPPPPTPMSPMSSSPSLDPFKVCLKVGNIAVCNGCRNTFSSADEIVVQHAEFRHFNSPRTGLLTSKYGNAYYHPNRKCIELKWGVNFWNSGVIIPDSVKPHLTPSQKDILFQEFGITA